MHKPRLAQVVYVGALDFGNVVGHMSFYLAQHGRKPANYYIYARISFYCYVTNYPQSLVA